MLQIYLIFPDMCCDSISCDFRQCGKWECAVHISQRSFTPLSVEGTTKSLHGCTKDIGEISRFEMKRNCCPPPMTQPSRGMIFDDQHIRRTCVVFAHMNHTSYLTIARITVWWWVTAISITTCCNILIVFKIQYNPHIYIYIERELYEWV